MIVVDTSALIAVVVSEPDAGTYANAMMNAPKLVASTGTVLEMSIVARSKLGIDGWGRVSALIGELGIESLAFDEDQLTIATQAYGMFGRATGHPARLNFGDCFSYALARSLDAPLLFKGDDFTHTDIRSAMEA